MKRIEQCALFVSLLFFSICLHSCIGKVPVDVVTADNELFFVLEKKYEISSVVVVTGPLKTGGKAMWSCGAVKSLKLKQIKYGQKLNELSCGAGPVELQKNVEYWVTINIGRKVARETFIIGDDNKAIMPHPTFERQKNRAYSVVIDKNGDKVFTVK